MKKWLYRITIAALLIVAASTIYQRSTGKAIPLFLGYGTAVIASGSMEPEYPVGSLIIVHKESDYKVDDVIVFPYDGIPTLTHRIVDIQEGQYVTKGDSNNVPEAHTTDPSVVIGKVIYVIPWLGAAMYALQDPMVIGYIVIFLTAIYFLFASTRKRKT